MISKNLALFRTRSIPGVIFNLHEISDEKMFSTLNLLSFSGKWMLKLLRIRFKVVSMNAGMTLLN